MLSQKLTYINITNLTELSLYILSLLVTINFKEYVVESGLQKLVEVENADFTWLDDVQYDTGLRQVPAIICFISPNCKSSAFCA